MSSFSQLDGEAVTVFMFDFTDKSEDEVRACYYALYRFIVFLCGPVRAIVNLMPEYKAKPSCRYCTQLQKLLGT